MADEQYEWLDANAAEKLLRGGSVEPVDDHPSTGARQLEAVLRAVRTPGPSTGELPGEAAVLAAFREASRAGKRAAAEPAGRAGRQDALRTVRIGAVRPASPRRPRWTRPLRYGLAVSLAGCALGGVAVAGGTGMLPAPFGGRTSPVPAASVSAAASPEELGAELPDAGEPPSPLPSDTPRPPSPPAASDAPGGGTAGNDGRPGQDDGGPADREDSGRDTATGGPQDGTDGRDAPEGPAEVYKRSVKACTSYREDTLSREDRLRLVELARGERNLDRFCDRLLDGDAHDGGSDGIGPGDGGSGGGDGESSLPSITFRTPSPSASGDASGDGTDAEPTAEAGVSAFTSTR